MELRASTLATFTGRMAYEDAVWRPHEVESSTGRALIRAGILKQVMSQYVDSEDDGPDCELQYDVQGRPFYISRGSVIYPEASDLVEYTLDWPKLLNAMSSAVGSPRAEVVVPNQLWSMFSGQAFAFHRRPVYFLRQLLSPENVGLAKTRIFDNSNSALLITGSPKIARYALSADMCRRCFAFEDVFSVDESGTLTLDSDLICEQLQIEQPPERKTSAPTRGTVYRKIEEELDRFLTILFERISKGKGEKCGPIMKAYTRRECAKRSGVGYDVLCKIFREKQAPQINVKWDTCHDMGKLYDAFERKYGRR